MANSSNAIEQIYDQIANLLGGTNPNQIFTMLMPGTVLNPTDYAYDTTNPKPAIVQEAESKLTDQMLDLAKVTGSTNGLRISSQYIQALSVLVPKFNPVMPLLKKTLRDFLNSPVLTKDKDGNPIPAVDDQGNEIKCSLGEYYFKLYENWIIVKEAWDTQIINKKEELKTTSPNSQNEDFLEWYELTAEAELAKIDEAMAKVLQVFAPTDMEAILGALASGPGGEIDEALNTVNDIRLASPDGGYFYPVDLTPSDWFLDLASDLDPVNLLKDPAFIATTIAARRQAMQGSINQVQAMLNQMPTQGAIKKAADNLTTAQTAYTAAQNNLLSTYTDNAAIAVNIYLEQYGDPGPTPTAADLTNFNAINKDVETSKKEPTPGDAKEKGGSPFTAQDVADIVAGQKKLIDAQSALQSSSQAVADAGMNLASEQAAYFGELPFMLTRLQSQLDDLNTMQSQLSSSIVATAAGTNSISKLKPATSPTFATPSAAKAQTSQRFMEVQMSFTSDQMLSTSSNNSSFSQTSWSVDLFFGSASGSNSNGAAASSKSSIDSSIEIQVAFKITKVDIGRGWMNPGVFKLAKQDSMSRMVATPIAVEQAKINNTQTIDWNQISNDGLFPGYPVSMVIAKDVSITFQANSTELSAVQSVIDSKSAVGGGFLCFSASSSSASHSDSSSLSSKSEGNVININMPGPQILGYFVELTSPDNSDALTFDPSQNTVPTEGVKSTDPDISIVNFVMQLKALNAK